MLKKKPQGQCFIDRAHRGWSVSLQSVIGASRGDSLKLSGARCSGDGLERDAPATFKRANEMPFPLDS